MIKKLFKNKIILKFIIFSIKDTENSLLDEITVINNLKEQEIFL